MEDEKKRESWRVRLTGWRPMRRDVVGGGEEGGVKEVPVLPVRGLVVFPGTMVPLTVGRVSNLRLLEETLPESKMIALMTQLHAEDEEPKPEGLFPVGVLVEVVRMVRQDAKTMVVLVGVQSRWRAKEFTQTEPYLKAAGEVLEDQEPAEEDDYWEAKVRNLRESASRLIELNPNIPDEAKGAVEGIDDAGVLTDFLASNLSLDLTEKQKLLEETDVVKRMAAVQLSVNNQLHIAELQAKLREDVETEFTDAQRRAYLREQVRAIQRELGEGDGSDEQAADLAEKIEKAGLPEAVRKEAARELRRLENIPAASPEHSVIVTYLETLCELPWDDLSEEAIDLKAARAVLVRDHYGLDKVKRRIIEYLAVRKLNPDGHGPILCFQGPPGVGKTSLGQSIADALGRKFSRIALGGIRDEAEIRGHRRTYIGSMPGRLIQELRRVGTRNPVIMLDEVDKIGADFRGDPSSALLEVLDPRQNHAFVDRYLDVPFDLSQVIFIATSNYLDNVPGPLRDRMEVLELPGYTEKEKIEIAKGYLTGRQIGENGLDAEKVKWSDEALELVVEKSTREAGVRELERQIGSVCRALAAEVAGGREGEILITPEVVRETLGAEKYVRDEKLKKSEPGVVTGLAWTPVGGEVLHIEAIKFPGKGSVTLTGQLGEVMRESVQAAMSLVRQRAAELSIDPEDFGKFDVHVHVPAGAVPKDGPSAGGAMFTALASLYSGRRVSNEVAMTGEISLRGLVLPIGGLKEKALAALNAGIKRVIIPAKNAKDLEDVPAEALEALEIVPVETVDEVLRYALVAEVEGEEGETSRTSDGDGDGDGSERGNAIFGGGKNGADFDSPDVYGNAVRGNPFLEETNMTTNIATDWNRYRENLVRYPEMGITLDISRMLFPADFFEGMSGACEKAFAEMRELEKGVIANADENRMVGHYWLRNPDLAPTAELREMIVRDRRAAQEFAVKVLGGEILTPDGQRFSRLLLVGIGGSALGPQLIADALAGGGAGLKVSFFDNTDPDGMDRTLGEIGDDLGRTLTVVVSKSGGTMETRNGMVEAERAYRAKGLDFGKYAVAVTGEGSALDMHAEGQGWIKRFPMADWVGGRTSVMSVVGLVPSALMGVDTGAFLDGAKAMDAETRIRRCGRIWRCFWR